MSDNPAVGNPVCPHCNGRHPPAWDCTAGFGPMNVSAPMSDDVIEAMYQALAELRIGATPHTMIDAMLRAAEGAGWRLVPATPSDDVLEAVAINIQHSEGSGNHSTIGLGWPVVFPANGMQGVETPEVVKDGYRMRAKQIYAAMLAAAPKLEEQG